MNAIRLGGEITLSGPPRNLTAIIPLDLARGTVVSISVTSAGQATIYRAVARQIGIGNAELRLRLPDHFASGTYTGEVTLNGKPQAVFIEVEAVSRIRIDPRQTVVTAEPSSTVQFTVTVTNGGNVLFEIPKADTLDLDDADGQDRALGRTLRAPLEGDERRVDRLFEELRQTHGGEGRVTVRSGAGRLPPGESRVLSCVLDVPESAQSGRSYVGAWQLGSAAHLIVADIMVSERPTKARVTR